MQQHILQARNFGHPGNAEKVSWHWVVSELTFALVHLDLALVGHEGKGQITDHAILTAACEVDVGKSRSVTKTCR